MSRLIPFSLAALAVVDLLGGTLLVVWPGVWQELLHPLAMGTVFYPVQRQGALWLARAVVEVAAARRPRPERLRVVAALWAVEVPAALFVAWRTAHTGAAAAPVHVILALVGAGVALILWRSAGKAAAGDRRVG